MRAFARWLFRNLGVKLVAVLLALVVYAHVATNRDQQLDFKVPLRLVNLSDSLSVMGPVPREVTVGLRGKGRDIYLALLRGTWAQCDLGDAGPGLVRHLLSPRDVKLPVGVSVSVADVVAPETLALQLDRRTQRRLPVRVVAERTGPGPMPALSLKADPESVNVDGPASILSHLAWVSTEPYPAARDRKGREGLAWVRSGSPYLNVNPRQVRVRVQPHP